MNADTFYLVREDILPEALLKTLHAKELLAHGTVKTVQEAVEKVGISRSAFYKYKDGIFPLQRLEREWLVTVSLDLEHRAGILSKVLSVVASLEGNVLTINQTIPLQGMANVVLSVDTGKMSVSTNQFLETLRTIDGVQRAHFIAQG
jgi:chorismate mutase